MKSSLLDATCRVAFAGLIHDLGKFAQRARIDASEASIKGSSSKPPSLNDGGADLFKRVTFDQVLKSVESSRER